MAGWGLLRGLDDARNGIVPNSGGILDGLSQPEGASGLSLILEPRDIATIPGLSQHVYDDAARQKQGSFVATNAQPDGYAPRLDQVSLTPWDGNPSGLDLSATVGQPADNQSKSGEKYKQGAKAAEIFGNAIDWWNDQNKILGLHFGPEGPEMLEKYTGPVGKGLVAVENGLKAGGEIANGAPRLPTVVGAGIKTGVELGGPALGSLIGGTLLTPVGLTPVGAVGGGLFGEFLADRAFDGKSNRQVGEAAGQSLYDGMVNNPYYDPRLIAMP
jgi:hypothetical protein